MQMLDPDDVITQISIGNKSKLANAIDLLFSPKDFKKFKERLGHIQLWGYLSWENPLSIHYDDRYMMRFY